MDGKDSGDQWVVYALNNVSNLGTFWWIGLKFFRLARSLPCWLSFAVYVFFNP
jgi:hypothetical protein